MPFQTEYLLYVDLNWSIWNCWNAEISRTKYHAIGRIFFKRNLVNVIYQQSCSLFRRYFLKFCSVTYKNKTQVGQQIAISSYSHILMDIEEQVILLFFSSVLFFFKFKSKVRVYAVRISHQPVQLYTSRVVFLGYLLPPRHSIIY